MSDDEYDVDWAPPEEYDPPTSSNNEIVREMIEAIQHADEDADNDADNGVSFQEGYIPAHQTSRTRSKVVGFFRGLSDEIRIVNKSARPVIIMYTQELIKSIIDHFATDIGANAIGAHVGADVARKVVCAKTVQSMLVIPPGQRRNVHIHTGYVLLSAFVVLGMRAPLLYSNVLMKKGYEHTLHNEDVEYPLGWFILDFERP